MGENKKIPFKQRFYLWLAKNIAGFLFRIIRITSRIYVVGGEHRRQLYEFGERCIFTVWHGSVFAPIMNLMDEGIIVLVSEHGDGEIIARILKNLGFGLVRGSTTRGGSRAVAEMVKRLRTPGKIAITPDGPKGPYRKLKMGAVVLAQMTGAPIIPIASYSDNRLLLNSWDKFQVVIPFGKCVIVYGLPIRVDSELTPGELEEKRKFVEREMHKLDSLAETYFDSTVEKKSKMASK